MQEKKNIYIYTFDFYFLYATYFHNELTNDKLYFTFCLIIVIVRQSQRRNKIQASKKRKKQQNCRQNKHRKKHKTASPRTDIQDNPTRPCTIDYSSATLEFENQCKHIEHTRCIQCNRLSLMNQIRLSDHLCNDCINSRKQSLAVTPDDLLITYQEGNETKYDVPSELSTLRIGEKILIQMISVFVPIHHLKAGQTGMKGHVCAFPQRIDQVCYTLPRMPQDVSLIRVIKKYKDSDGIVDTKTFSIRKEKVLTALRWLKVHNQQYRNIVIEESNLEWMTQEEQQLPSRSIHQKDTDGIDLGPAPLQTEHDSQTDETVIGALREEYDTAPKTSNEDVINEINKSIKSSSAPNAIDFPFVSAQPVCEYANDTFLFERAFPWLFPGGTGGYNALPAPKPDLAKWMERTIRYADGRFSTDPLWAFFASDYRQRHQNQDQGAFYVKSSFHQGISSLTDLQEKVRQGNMDWVNRICYFTQRVTGSAGYWRAKRREVHTWINYHASRGHGLPSFFITLSCAEYQWPDIKRLILDHHKKAGTTPPDFQKESFPKIINDHSLIVQEYFMLRVQIWLRTVGKEIFKIKHHWLRYEFAPTRGQIHAHMLLITDHMKVHETCYELRNDKEQLAAYISNWMQDSFGMTASVPANFNSMQHHNPVHPASVYYSEMQNNDDDESLSLHYFQYHQCSKYCMNKSKNPSGKRECRMGAGIEKTEGKADTPGFEMRNKPAIVHDRRGFDKCVLPRNNCRIIQTSIPMMRSWRANCDVQFLLYNSNPHELNSEDIARVVNYIVAYACKGNETELQEKRNIASIILSAREEMGDQKDITRLVRKLLNEASKCRMISKQEALCQLARLQLYDCSESVWNVSIAGSVKLDTNKEATSTFIAKYANRKVHLDKTLDEYFHLTYNYPGKNGKTIIPNYVGSRFETPYPPTLACA